MSESSACQNVLLINSLPKHAITIRTAQRTTVTITYSSHNITTSISPCLDQQFYSCIQCPRKDVAEMGMNMVERYTDVAEECIEKW